MRRVLRNVQQTERVFRAGRLLARDLLGGPILSIPVRPMTANPRCPNHALPPNDTGCAQMGAGPSAPAMTCFLPGAAAAGVCCSYNRGECLRSRDAEEIPCICLSVYQDAPGSFSLFPFSFSVSLFPYFPFTFACVVVYLYLLCFELELCFDFWILNDAGRSHIITSIITTLDESTDLYTPAPSTHPDQSPTCSCQQYL